MSYTSASYLNFNSFGAEFPQRFGYSIPNYPQCSFQESAARPFSQPFSGFSERLPSHPNTTNSHDQTTEPNSYRGPIQREKSSPLRHLPVQQNEMELSPSGSSELEALSENSSDQGIASHFNVFAL